jgi:hypothetical protein
MTVLDAISVQEGRLRTVRYLLTAALVPAPMPTAMVIDQGNLDMIDDVAEVARIVRHSVSWVRKNGHRLPGFSQPGGKGTRVTWKRSALRQYASSSRPGDLS